MAKVYRVVERERVLGEAGSFTEAEKLARKIINDARGPKDKPIEVFAEVNPIAPGVWTVLRRGRRTKMMIQEVEVAEKSERAPFWWRLLP